MHLRRHGRWFEIWTFSPVRRRTHRWEAKGHEIPDSVLRDFPTDKQRRLQDRVDEILTGEYPEPSSVICDSALASDLLNQVTLGCSMLRWGRISPDAKAQLVIASVRLQESLAAVGCPARRPRPKRQTSPTR